MRNINVRMINFISFWTCSGIIAFAFYLQFFMNIQPCPLCVLERILFFIIAVTLLASVIHNPSEKGNKLYGAIILMVAIAGMAASARHLWLQANPNPMGEICIPGFGYLFKTLPISEALKTFITGTASCSQAGWRFLGITIPGWTFIFFDIFALLGLSQLTGLFFYRKHPTN
jgi:protein dithiol:quinone oxidoreductase